MTEEVVTLEEGLSALEGLELPRDLLPALLHLRAHGLQDVVRRHSPWLARRCALDLAVVRDVLRFEEAVHSSLRQGRRDVALCEGTWCRFSGAEGLRKRLEEALSGLGLAVRLERYHCLAHCEKGPNVSVGASVHCTGEGSVDWDVPQRHRENWIPVEE